ncbi:MAG: response regulator [Betaproteobacteria bacterium]
MGNGPHVMVVDDEAVHRETLSVMLMNAGVKVTACENALDALAVLRGDAVVDLILSDVLMPGMDGIEFSRQARQLRPGTPLVLVTGRDSAMDAVVTQGNIALLKPYTADTLNGVLHEHLGIKI